MIGLKLIVVGVAVTAATLGILFSIAYGSFGDSSTNSIPFDVTNGINIGDYFATPIATDSLVPSSASGTNAPAITGCKVTNNVGLVAVDGSIYYLSNSSPQFSPVAQSIVSNPYNGKVLSSVLVNVNLYCDPSTLTKYNYYPNLTGGTLSLLLQGRNPSQTMVTEFIADKQLTAALVNGQTVQIAQFQIAVSQVAAALPTSSSNYYSQQNIITTGTLYFKQGQQSYQPTFTHVISPLYTSFSFLISPSGQSATTSQQKPAINLSNPQSPIVCSSGTIPVQSNGYWMCTTPNTISSGPMTCLPNTVVIGNSCVNLIQNIVLVNGKTSYFLPSQNYVIYSVVVNSWQSGQPYPTIKLTNLDTQTSVIYILSPNSRPNGYPKISTDSGSLVMTDVLQFNTDLNNQAGRYQIQLMSSPLGNYNRPSVSQDFVIYNPTTPPPIPQVNYASTTGTCPLGQYATQTSNGLICTSASNPVPVSQSTISCPNGGTLINTGNGGQQCMSNGVPVAQPMNSPVTLPTQSSDNVCATISGSVGQCVPVSNILGTNPIINSIQQILLYFHAFG